VTLAHHSADFDGWLQRELGNARTLAPRVAAHLLRDLALDESIPTEVAAPRPARFHGACTDR
jgi:hypothetical protein